MADPGFLDGNLLISQMLQKNCMKTKKIGPREGRTSKICLYRSAIANLYPKILSNDKFWIINEKELKSWKDEGYKSFSLTW